MYFLNHLVVDWDKVKTVEDIVRLLKAMKITFEVTDDVADIADLVRSEPKPPAKATMD